jgi:hypothetical protein
LATGQISGRARAQNIAREVRQFNTVRSSSKEATIIARMIRPEQDELTDADIARATLRLGLDQSGLDRLHSLGVKDQDAGLRPAESSELESHLSLSLIVGRMHASALHAQHIPLNAVEEWSIVAAKDGHPFHIHVNPFQVQVPYPDGTNPWVWRDTLFVSEGQTATVRSRFLYIKDHERVAELESGLTAYLRF